MPFVSKATGVPLARLAALVMVGKTLDELGVKDEVVPTHYSVKESVFPFNKFPGVDIILGPEMKSTGEVMGIDDTLRRWRSPRRRWRRTHRCPTRAPCSSRWPTATRRPWFRSPGGSPDMGYKLIATRGTAKFLAERGIAVEDVPKIAEGRPNLLDKHEERRGGVDHQHAERPGEFDGRGADPRGGRGQPRDLHHDALRRPRPRSKRAGAAPRAGTHRSRAAGSIPITDFRSHET